MFTAPRSLQQVCCAHVVVNTTKMGLLEIWSGNQPYRKWGEKCSDERQEIRWLLLFVFFGGFFPLSCQSRKRCSSAKQNRTNNTPERAIFLPVKVKHWRSQSTICRVMESIPAPTSSLHREPEAYVCQMSIAERGIWKSQRLARGVLYRRNYYPNNITCRQSLQEYQP